jgi:RND family efflux transporter MFP subunit
MPASMLLGRVLLPALGLFLAGLLAWQSFRGGSFDFRLPLALSSLTGAPDRLSASPTPVSLTRRLPGSWPGILAEGHVTADQGAEVVLGAELAGTISRVLVREKSVVRKGDLLVEFRGAEIRASAEEAVARVNEADAELTQIELELSRVDRQPASQPGKVELKDRLNARWNAAKARRAAMVAGYRRVEAEFARTRVRAPLDGVVISVSANTGETVNLGAPLVRIVDLKRLRIEAEVDEFDIPRCTVGSAVTISAPGYGTSSWKGKVEEIADCLTARRLRPDDPGRPTDTRILPVRISFQDPTPLKLGQRIEVEIETAETIEQAAAIASKETDSTNRR